MAAAHVAGVLLVVAEVFVLEDAVLVADQPIGLHAVVVELDLQLHVLGDHHQRRPLIEKQLASFVHRVDVGVVPIAIMCELFELAVLEVVHAEAEDCQVDARLPLLFDQPDEFALTRDTHIEVAICGQDHAIDAALDEALGCLGIGTLDAAAAVGRTAGRETLNPPR